MREQNEDTSRKIGGARSSLTTGRQRMIGSRRIIGGNISLKTMKGGGSVSIILPQGGAFHNASLNPRAFVLPEVLPHCARQRAFVLISNGSLRHPATVNTTLASSSPFMRGLGNVTAEMHTHTQTHTARRRLTFIQTPSHKDAV